MDSGFHFTAVGRVAAAGSRVIGAMDFGLGAAGALDAVGASAGVAIAGADFAARGESEVSLGRILAKIVLLDVQDFGERHGAGAGTGVLGVIDGFHLVDLAVGIIVDHDAQRAEHGHGAQSRLVQIFAEEVFEQAEFGGAVGLGHTDAAAEVANGLGRVAAAAQAGDGGHARIVPTIDV